MQQISSICFCIVSLSVCVLANEWVCSGIGLRFEQKFGHVSQTKAVIKPLRRENERFNDRRNELSDDCIASAYKVCLSRIHCDYILLVPCCAAQPRGYQS